MIGYSASSFVSQNVLTSLSDDLLKADFIIYMYTILNNKSELRKQFVCKFELDKYLTLRLLY